MEIEIIKNGFKIIIIQEGYFNFRFRVMSEIFFQNFWYFLWKQNLFPWKKMMFIFIHIEDKKREYYRIILEFFAAHFFRAWTGKNNLPKPQLLFFLCPFRSGNLLLAKFYTFLTYRGTGKVPENTNFCLNRQLQLNTFVTKKCANLNSKWRRFL